ncbi:MAG TPA: ABC transporter ATP-binding protein [Acidobacteriota bacterium]|nr:ABC transporter ATP-binding protein [Acidobacteriota bacterium]
MSGYGAGLHVDVEVQIDDFQLKAALDLEGGILVLFGPSGAGKSTALQAVAGLIAPSAGEIQLNGETLFRKNRQGAMIDVPARHRRVGYVFQDYALFPHLTALGNVAFPLWRRPDAHGRALEQLRRVDLAELAARYPHEMSGGQQQRVAIARALVSEPRILLLDEPFTALDLETRRRVRGEIRALLRKADIPVVLVTHDREEALAMGDRIVILDDGQVIANGNPLELLGRPPRERTARLVGVENLLRLKVREVLPAEGVIKCGRGQFSLETPLTDARVGDEITVGLRADDVLLATVRPHGLSARNAIPAKVLSVQPHGAVYEVRMDCGGVPLASHVTRKSVEELNIAPGTDLWAIVKTASCFVLRE